MIAIGCDHAGFSIKSIIIHYLEEKGYSYKDFGTNSTNSVDYPDYAHKVAKAVSSGECEKGILICGTGIGMSIAANKVEGIRAALCTDTFMARMSREHNDANILTLGERVLGKGLILDIVDIWLNTNFSNGKHSNRVNKISAIVKKYSS